MTRGADLLLQPWWQSLHIMINDAFHNKRHSVYPPSWLRLDADPNRAAEGLSHELGPNGHFAVVLSEERKPIACGGVLPYRGDVSKQMGKRVTRRVVTTWSLTQLEIPRVCFRHANPLARYS